MKIKLLSRACGYTFVELLVAITILGFIITPFLNLFIFSFSSIENAGKYTTAINLGREKMEDIKARGYNNAYEYYIVDGNNPHPENDIDSWPQYRRVTEVYPLNLNGEDLYPNLELLSIKITVYWTTGETEYSEVLESTLCQR